MTPEPQDMEYPELGNNLITGWLGVDAVANPYHGNSSYLWSPQTYPASNLRELALHLKQISDLAIDQIDEASRSALTHENDRYLQYDALVEPFLKSLGLNQFSLQEIIDQIENPYSQVWKQLMTQAKKRERQINERLAQIWKDHDLYESLNLEELKQSFCKENEHLLLQGATQSELNRTSSEALRFFICVFVLEREGLVPEKIRLLGRSIAQCTIAHQFVNDILNNRGLETQALLKLIHQIKRYYKDVEPDPKSLVHKNAHPHEFLQGKDGKWILGGCESLHFGCFYKDIAEEYVRKLVRAYLSEKPDQKDEILKKIQAVLIPNWLGSCLPHIMSYCVVDFAQELQTLFLSYSMDPNNIDLLNLTITPNTYLKEMRERIALEAYYREEVLDLIKTLPPYEQK
ncbi:MAG: hypothetical protein AAF443_07985 [Chlamydiota bacterium]